MDLEMAFEEDYHEVMGVIDETLKAIFRGLQKNYAKEVGLRLIRRFTAIHSSILRILLDRDYQSFFPTRRSCRYRPDTDYQVQRRYSNGM